ncbi:MAG: protein kinase [Planctomycetota bacterium]
MGQDADPTTADQAFLDGVFEQALERLEDALPADLDELLQGRSDLRAQVEQLVRLAEQVAVGHYGPFPQVPGYTILGELGRGGMGTVYLARQERLGGRPVALKVLPASVALSSQARERFRTEANAIARLRHPNIVAVYDVVQESGVYAYAMEWVEGKSLAEVIDQLKGLPQEPGIEDLRKFLLAPDGTLGQSTVAVFLCRVGVAIARALAAVHREGLLHRDVKPSNILLRRDGTALLSDFGLVRHAESATITLAGHFVGTPAYAAPEQLRGHSATLDARTDVYALGATLYHALALRTPFAGRSTAELLLQIEKGLTVPLRRANPKLPQDLQTIVAKAMDADPARRYATPDELADDLERLLNLQPIRARPAGLVTRTVKLARRNRPAVIGAAFGGVLALVVAVGIGWYTFIVPGWVSRHLSDARLALLDPAQNDCIFIAVYWQSKRRKMEGVPDTFLRPALASYRAALRWHPTDASIRLERDVVQLAYELCRHPDRVPEWPARLEQRAAVACVYARRWAEGDGPPQIEPVVLERASAIELRCLGLLAFLCADVETSLAAWSRMDLLEDPDPLVEASLGQLYLLLDQPARAYPRLRNAFRAFPDAGFICVNLADAALQCGDFSKAEKLLEQARSMRLLDQTRGLERVEADLYVATGQHELALQKYLAISEPHTLSSTVILYRFGLFLESRGDLYPAMQRYRQACGSAPGFYKARRALVRVAESWWDGLTLVERWRFLRRVLRDGPADIVPPYGLLGGYRYSLDWLATHPAPRLGTALVAAPNVGSAPADQSAGWHAQAEPSGARRSAGMFHPSTLSSTGGTQHGRATPAAWQAGVAMPPTLKELTDRMALDDPARWSRLRAYPRWLQELQIAAWLGHPHEHSP